MVIDGDLMIADPYFAGVPARQLPPFAETRLRDFPDDLYRYVEQSLRFVRNMGISLSITETYLLVPPEREVNVPCDRYIPILNRQVDEHFQYGCTFRADTFLFIAKFSRASVQQQFLALVHEQLWRTTQSQADISAFTTALMEILPIYEAQRRAVVDNVGLPATPNLAQKVQTLFRTARAVGLSLSEHKLAGRFADFTIAPHGGLLDPSCANSLVQNSIASLNSEISGCSSGIAIENSQILFSSVSHSRISNSHLLDSTVGYSVVENAQIKNSDFNNAPNDEKPAAIVRNGRFVDANLGPTDGGIIEDQQGRRQEFRGDSRQAYRP